MDKRETRHSRGVINNCNRQRKNNSTRVDSTEAINDKEFNYQASKERTAPKLLLKLSSIIELRDDSRAYHFDL